jgi:hypothetical protein
MGVRCEWMVVVCVWGAGVAGGKGAERECHNCHRSKEPQAKHHGGANAKGKMGVDEGAPKRVYVCAKLSKQTPLYVAGKDSHTSLQPQGNLHEATHASTTAPGG